MAAEGGYDTVAWTTGEQQAARYDLSKHISEVAYADTGRLVAKDHSGRTVIDRYTDDRGLPGIVGKEIADRLIAGKGTEATKVGLNPARRLRGLDLKVGGEGMIGFYDRTLPNLFRKVARSE